MPGTMGYLHALAALAIAGYLYSVNRNDAHEKLYGLLREDVRPFMQWGLAGAVLAWAFAQVGGPLGSGLAVLTMTGIALQVGPEIVKGVESVIGTRFPLQARGDMKPEVK